jgi:hypothetical protein
MKLSETYHVGSSNLSLHLGKDTHSLDIAIQSEHDLDLFHGSLNELESFVDTLIKFRDTARKFAGLEIPSL